MKNKKVLLKGRVSKIDRFNKDPKYTNFFNEFQEIMIQRLNLNYIDKYHKDNINQITRSVYNRPRQWMNTNITDGFLLTCNVEPEVYIQIQETIKKVTGNFMPMDEIIHLLLTYFCYIYKDELPKDELPYKHIFKGLRFNKLLLFQKHFKKFYKNTVRDFKE